jgi:hypothetical protein
MVFHCPQLLHLPAHLADCAPQLWQKKVVFTFDMKTKLGEKVAGACYQL